MASPIYTVIDDKIIIVHPQNAYKYKSYNGIWHLYPCIQGGIEWNGQHEEPHIRMGLFDADEKKIYDTTFVWNHIRITSIDVVPSEKTRLCFNARIEICPNEFGKKPFEHFFTVKNGIYFFMNSVLKTINQLLDERKEISDINFDFFDKQCVLFNFLAATNQSYPHFELGDCSLRGYYDLIKNIEVTVYKNGVQNRYGYLWNEVTLKVLTDNKYFVKIIYDIIHTLRGVDDLKNPCIENGVTTFFFKK